MSASLFYSSSLNGPHTRYATTDVQSTPFRLFDDRLRTFSGPCLFDCIIIGYIPPVQRKAMMMLKWSSIAGPKDVGPRRRVTALRLVGESTQIS